MIHRLQLRVLLLTIQEAGRRGDDWASALLAVRRHLPKGERLTKKIKGKLWVEYGYGRRQAKRERRATE